MRVTLALALMLGLAGPLWADGVVIPADANAEVRVPDQQAILAYEDGVETLVIETAFEGEGRDFAWIVPLPSPPEVSQASTGLFPTLRWLTRPVVVHNVRHVWIGVAFGLFVCALLLARKLAAAMTVVVAATLIASCFLPALGAGGAASTTAHGVTVYERRVVGSYDTAVLTSANGEALLTWLHDNGFATPASARPVIEAYAREGWSFAAAKLRRDSGSGRATPHPLAFRFKTDEMIYPLRLTGTAVDRCAIDLYVFGSSRSAAPGFDAAFAQPLESPKRPSERAASIAGKPFPLMHAELGRIAGRSTYLTKLSGTLDAEAMSSDLLLSWNGGSPTCERYFTRRGAGVLALNVFAIGTAGALFLVWWDKRKKRPAAPGRGCFAWASVAAFAIAGAGTYLALPKLDARVSRLSWMMLRVQHESLTLHLRAKLEDSIASASQAREVLLAMKAEGSVGGEHDDRWFWSNRLTGEPLREENSPGNYVVRTQRGKVEYIWFDGLGGEHAIEVGPAALDPSVASESRPTHHQ